MVYSARKIGRHGGIGCSSVYNIGAGFQGFSSSAVSFRTWLEAGSIKPGHGMKAHTGECAEPGEGLPDIALPPHEVSGDEEKAASTANLPSDRQEILSIAV